jgi:hypothetical protein
MVMSAQLAQQCKDNSVRVLQATMFITVIIPIVTSCLLWTSKSDNCGGLPRKDMLEQTAVRHDE